MWRRQRAMWGTCSYTLTIWCLSLLWTTRTCSRLRAGTRSRRSLRTPTTPRATWPRWSPTWRSSSSGSRRVATQTTRCFSCSTFTSISKKASSNFLQTLKTKSCTTFKEKMFLMQSKMHQRRKRQLKWGCRGNLLPHYSKRHQAEPTVPLHRLWTKETLEGPHCKLTCMPRAPAQAQWYKPRDSLRSFQRPKHRIVKHSKWSPLRR